MLSRKLMNLLETFSKYDLNRLKKYLTSPLFNENQELVKLFDIIDQFLRQQDNLTPEESSALQKKQVWSDLFPHRSYNDAHLRRLCSELTKHIYSYLTLWSYYANPIREQCDLLGLFQEAKLEKHFNGILRQAHLIQEKSTIHDAKFHYYQYLIEHFSHLNRELSGQKIQQFENLEKADFHLDCYYFTQKLKHYCDALDYKNTLSTPVNIQIIPSFLAYLRQNNYLAVPSVHAYYLVAQMLLHPEEEDFFHQLRQLLQQQAVSFSQAELNTLYIYLKNYCIDTKINNGRSEYFNELFQIFKTLLQQEIIISNGQLDPQDYKNIITVGLHIEEFSWVVRFIQHYTGMLPEVNQENALNYNLAKVYFHQENYVQVIEQLREVEYKNLVYALGSKLMLLKTYYELNEYLALDSLIDSFRIYLRRNKRISREVKQQYLNVLRFVKKLSNVDIYDQNSIQKIRTQISECKALASKKWLLEKVAKLEKPEKVTSSNFNAAKSDQKQ